MAITDEQVVQMSAALRERRLSNEQIRALHEAIDGVYDDMRFLYKMCADTVPESVQRPLSETTKDIGALREAILDARLAITGDRSW